MKRKVELEQFFTPPAIAEKCVASLLKHVPTDAVWVEPSAGSGNFMRAKPGSHGIDIAPMGDGIHKADFLTLKMDDGLVYFGNPPFGQRGSLAMKFIYHCIKFQARRRGFYPSRFVFAGKFPATASPPGYGVIESFPVRDFQTPQGGTILVDCVWAVIKRNQAPVPKTPLAHPDLTIEHRHCSRTSSGEIDRLIRESDFVLPQVGRIRLIHADAEKRKGSRYYVKCEHPERFRNVRFDDDPRRLRSIGKGDIIKAYLKT